MRRHAQLFLCAVQFLTRLPVPPLPGFEPGWIAQSARYFPLVGQIVGALSALVLLASAQVWTGILPPLLAIAFGILVTGAFHEDGLADTADGLGGGSDRASRLAIMKDSRIGTYGAIALGVCVVIKTAALASVQPWLGAILLVAAHGAGRAAAVIVMYGLPYAGDPESAKIKPTPIGVSRASCLVAVLIGLWPLLFLAGAQAVIGVAGGAVLGGLIVFAARRLIGGQTGDVLGAIEQMFEVGFFLGATAALHVASS